MRTITIALVIGLWTLASAGCAERSGDQEGAQTAEPSSAIAPLSAEDFADLIAANQGRVVLVNLWATWCSPCLKEIPELIRLDNAYGDDLNVVGISLDTDQPSSTVTAFRDKHFPGFASYLSSEPEWDLLVDVIDPAWDQVLPTSFVIDRDGELAQILTGGKPYEDFAAAVDKVL